LASLGLEQAGKNSEQPTRDHSFVIDISFSLDGGLGSSIDEDSSGTCTVACNITVVGKERLANSTMEGLDVHRCDRWLRFWHLHTIALPRKCIAELEAQVSGLSRRT